jgi:hypothetical protein
MTPRRLAYATLIVALVASGFYVFVYLVRWEWNRALIAGVFFIGAEVALIGAALYEKLRAIERRVAQTGSPRTLERVQEAAPEPHNHFAWLTENRGDLSVFVPVLMGAGLIVSGLAWLVERLSRATAQPVLEHRLAARMAPLALPVGGLMGAPSPAVKADGTAAVHPPAMASAMLGVSPGVHMRGASPNRLMKGAVTALALALGLYIAIDALADLTQNRPDAPVAHGSTQVVMTVEASDSDFYSPLVAARGLWNHCRGTINQSSPVPGRLDARDGIVTLVVEPAIGENTEKRLVGCLQDATIDHVNADVLFVRAR